MEKGNPERRKLKVNSVGKAEEKLRRDGQGTFKSINFNADDITDSDVKKGYAYSIANPILIPVIETAKKDDILEADVRKLTGEREDGTGWTIHQVVQLYKDGQPIGGQKQRYGKSPEIVQMEINAKAKNTALMQACELAKAVGTIDTTGILSTADEFYAWLQNGHTVNKEPQVAKAAPKDKMAEEIVRGAEEAGKPLYGEEPTFENNGQLMTYLKEHSIDTMMICTALSINAPRDIKDPNRAYQDLKHLIKTPDEKLFE